MKKIFLPFVFCLVTLASQAQSAEQQFINDNFDFAVKQTRLMLQSATHDKPMMPHSAKDGKVINTGILGWTSGFFPGMLWYLAERSGDAALKDSALAWTHKMEPAQHFTYNHDIGFMMYCSYGNAYRITKNEAYKPLLIQSAKSLMTRYDARLGVIKSWNSWSGLNSDEVFNFPVIIDNMMNLELLFFASKATGDKRYQEAAISHALKTRQDIVRKDGSCYHLMTYDSATAKPIKGFTSQGYADNSAWSRGQGWGIYGFTQVYRDTRDARFLKTAQAMADFFIDHKNLPSDKIPWWDFNAHQPGYKPGQHSIALNVVTNYRDASAAAVTASGLLELSTYTKGEKGKKYFETARQILHALGSPNYRAKEGANAHFILMHSVGSLPHDSEVDVPLTYADYYFVEALKRYEALLNHQPLW